MTTAALLLHAATTLEASAVRGRNHRRDGEEGEAYWRGADDALTWVLGTLRGRADELTAASERIERLRTLATRASAGTWRALHDGDQATLVTYDGRLGKLAPEIADYLVVAQPHVILALLNALDQPDAEAPPAILSELEDATRRLSRTPWTFTGCFIRDRDGADLGWLHHSHDIDFVAAATPQFIGRVARTLRTVRGA